MTAGISRPYLVAAIQATSVFLNRAATIETACALISGAACYGARFVLFPEAFVPAYPDWVWVISPGKKKLLNPLYAELLENAVTIPSRETERFCAASVRQARML